MGQRVLAGRGGAEGRPRSKRSILLAELRTLDAAGEALGMHGAEAVTTDGLLTGKLPPRLLERLFRWRGAPDRRVLVGPGCGVDAAVVAVGRHRGYYTSATLRAASSPAPQRGARAPRFIGHHRDNPLFSFVTRLAFELRRTPVDD